MSGDDAVDPITGLTKREKDIIRDTWAVVRKDIKGNGGELFVRFFTENPSYQQLFKSFKDVPMSELKTNKKVLAHANSVMYAISSLVDNLEDPECLVEMLGKLGTSHNTRGIDMDKFHNLGITLVGLLQAQLGPKVMDTAAVEAWKKTYGVITSVIAQSY
jgi:hemoglobin-like flavoprotein